MLQLAHLQTSALVEDLKSFDLAATSSVSRSINLSAASMLDALESREGRGTAIALPISVMLENATEEIFVRYTEGARYIDKERSGLLEQYNTYLGRFIKYHVGTFHVA